MGRSPWSRVSEWWRHLVSPPTRFGGYRPVRIVHDGEKSVVYEARSGDDDVPYALKVYKPLYNRTARRICKRYRIPTEGEVGQMLNPPPGQDERNYPIVRTVAHGWEYDDRTRPYYLVLEFVDGFNLKHLIGCEHPLLEQCRLDVAVSLGHALERIHGRGLVHRDVCTGNVLLYRDGRPKLVDLGFAAPQGLKFREKSGTPSYMSPEQFLIQPIYPTSDIYSYGVVLFELFTGRLPFTSALPSNQPQLVMRRSRELMDKHLKQTPPRPSRANPALPPALHRVVLRCLEKSPERRYRNMRAVLADLRRVPWPAGEAPSAS